MTHPPRRRTAIALTALVAAPLALVTATSTPATADDHPLASSIVLSWHRTALAAMHVDTSPAPAPPVSAMYLSFMSLAVHEAALAAQRQGTHAAAAAVATAAHDVLWEYFPAARPRLAVDLDDSLDRVRDGRAQDRGIAIGAAAADRMIASRVGDGRNDATVVYSKAAAPGIWQPAAGGSMGLAWLAFLEPVVDVPVVQLDGHDSLDSEEYAVDYNEVKRVGSTTSSPLDRTAEQTEISRFFNGNPTPMYRDALLRYLETEPMGLLPTTRLFARIDAAVTTAFIQTWRLKYDVGFWRPFQAIAGADTDGNLATESQAGWAPLVPNPGYSDYTSGHAAATAPYMEVLRATLGEDTPLELRLTGFEPRAYDTLSALEHDALHARIWGGLHFRDAMDDGYYLGHTTAQRVMRVLR